MTSFGEVLDRLIEATLARVDRHAGERRAEEPVKAKKTGRPKISLSRPAKSDEK